MSSEDTRTAPARGQDFREAVAQWRLAVHTEVKKVSSLPTAMFDATDPMLEMRLAETTEAMLARLHVPDPQLTDGPEENEGRLEKTDLAELGKLPGLIAERPAVKLDLLSQLTGEYLGILADSCCTQEGTARQRAAEHICSDFGVTAENLDETLKELHRMTLEADAAAKRSRERDEISRVVEEVAKVLRNQVLNGSAAGEDETS